MRTTKPKVVDGYLVGQKPGNIALTPGLCLVYEGVAYHVVSESRVRRTANGWGYYTLVTLHTADGREIVVPDSLLRRKGRLAGGPFDLGIVLPRMRQSAPLPWRAGSVARCGCQRTSRLSLPMSFSCMRALGHTGNHRALVQWSGGGWTDMEWGTILDRLVTSRSGTECIGDVSHDG